ncbi:MAG: GYD domain-containing protein [Solimonas sp.]
MPKYLVEVDYSVEGTKGLLKDGGSKRRAVVEGAIKGVGGKLESFYYTFGIRDAVLIAELPNNEAAIAISMTVGASGSVRLRTTPLITVEEVDRATKVKVGYKPPGAK